MSEIFELNFSLEVKKIKCFYLRAEKNQKQDIRVKNQDDLANFNLASYFLNLFIHVKKFSDR